MRGHKRVICRACLTTISLIVLVSGMAQAQTSQNTPAQAAPSKPAPEQTAKYQREAEERLHNDWAYLARYREDNAKLGPPAAGVKRVVFMGDSITEGWGQRSGKFFPGKPYINRGISGQTTPQMLVRFRPDVIALRPKVVVILAGTNDIAENTGPATLEMIEDNLMSMVDLAKANGIRVVIASVLPAFDFPWRPGLKPAGKIAALNAWIKTYAAGNEIVYLDYYSAMVDERQRMKAEFSFDGVHPNDAGYGVMAPLVERAITEALGQR
jgi:lysophospholipase L1-like esterase